MTRIVDFEEMDLRAELGEDGRIRRVLDQRGSEMGFVTSDVNPSTGGSRFTNMPDVFASSFSGAAKYFGSVVNSASYNQTAGLSSSDHSARLKIEAEADFDGIQLVVINPAGNAVNNTTALVAVTETAKTDSANNISQPVISGSTYPSLVGSGNLGHRAVTWSGGGVLNQPSGATAAQIAVSDMIDINSVPRADGGSRPLAVISMQHAAVDGNYSFLSTWEFAYSRIEHAENPRVLQVCNPTAAVSTPSNTASTLANAAMLVFPVFRYLSPCLNVLVAGDSTDQGYETSSSRASWGSMGCYTASVPERPINYMNVGCAAKSSDEFWARTKEILTSGVKVDVLVISPISVNDAYSTNYTTKLAAMRRRRSEILRTAKQYGVRYVCFIPLKPYNANDANADGYRLALNAENREFAARIPGLSMLDFSALGDGAVPEKWIRKYNQHFGRMGVLLNLPKVSSDPTNYVSGTTYTATVTVDGVACPISFLGSQASTFGALIDVLNTQINAGMSTSGISYASLYGGLPFIKSATIGVPSTVAITAGTAFASPLANFVAVTASLQSAGYEDGIHNNTVASLEVMAPALTKYLKSLNA